jgi:hypothetical protein
MNGCQLVHLRAMPVIKGKCTTFDYRHSPQQRSKSLQEPQLLIRSIRIPFKNTRPAADVVDLTAHNAVKDI